MSYIKNFSNRIAQNILKDDDIRRKLSELQFENVKSSDQGIDAKPQAEDDRLVMFNIDKYYNSTYEAANNVLALYSAISDIRTPSGTEATIKQAKTRYINENLNTVSNLVLNFNFLANYLQFFFKSPQPQSTVITINNKMSALKDIINNVIYALESAKAQAGESGRVTKQLDSLYDIREKIIRNDYTPLRKIVDIPKVTDKTLKEIQKKQAALSYKPSFPVVQSVEPVAVNSPSLQYSGSGSSSQSVALMLRNIQNATHKREL